MFSHRYAQKILSSYGIGPHMQSLADISEDFVRKSYVAICDSNDCRKKYKLKRVKKPVTNGTSFCPDCGHALFWEQLK